MRFSTSKPMFQPECSRMFQNACRPMSLHADCRSMNLHAGQWACIRQLHKLACSSMSLHAVPWACMQFHEPACSFMSLDAVSWPWMQFHELLDSFFLCWSRSQEFRSACFPIFFVKPRHQSPAGVWIGKNRSETSPEKYLWGPLSIKVVSQVPIYS